MTFDRRMTEDQIKDLNQERIERREELAALREDHNKEREIGICYAPIMPDPDLDIGV